MGRGRVHEDEEEWGWAGKQRLLDQSPTHTTLGSRSPSLRSWMITRSAWHALLLRGTQVAASVHVPPFGHGSG